MEKLKKTAKGLDVVCKVLFWILTVSATLLLISFVVVLFVDKDVFSTGMANGQITVGNGIIFKLSTEDVGSFNMKPFSMFSMAIGFLVCGIVIYALRVIRSMLSPMKNGKPFNSAVGNGFRKLGWFTIIIGICVNLFDIIGKAAITNWLVNILKNAKVPFEIATQHGFSLNFILTAFLLFLLSYVFRYGEELQQLSDETL